MEQRGVVGGGDDHNDTACFKSFFVRRGGTDRTPKDDDRRTGTIAHAVGGGRPVGAAVLFD